MNVRSAFLSLCLAVTGSACGPEAPATPAPEATAPADPLTITAEGALLQRLVVGDVADATVSSSQTVAGESLGARQSLRGDSDPPEPTFGPFGIAERLNWLPWKKRCRNTSSQRRIVARS